MLKIAEIYGNQGFFVSYPVDADANWSQEARKLAHTPPLFIQLVNIRDVRPDDDLEEMLESQHARFVEFAGQNEDLVTDEQYDDGIDLYCDTWEALP